MDEQIRPAQNPNVSVKNELISSTPVKKRSKLKLVLWAILALVIILLLVQYTNAAKYEALVQVIDEDRIGVNPTSERLDFGDLPKDKDAIRTVSLQNQSSYKMPSYVIVWERGEISDLMRVSKNFFTLDPGQTQRLDFTVHVPSSAEFKYYKGSVVIFQIPKIW